MPCFWKENILFSFCAAYRIKFCLFGCVVPRPAVASHISIKNEKAFYDDR